MTHPLAAIDVVRAVGVSPEIRAVDGSLGTLVLRFSTFDTWYPVSSMWEGDFLERTKRGAFRQTIREDGAGIRALFDHGFDPQIGNKVLGPIEGLREEPDSPVGEVPLFDTSYNRDLLPGLKAGVYGSSFRFRVLEEAWNDEPEPSEYNPRAVPERTILRVKLMEFGPVTFPANPAATAEMNSAGMRSLTDSFYERLKTREPGAYAAAARSAAVARPARKPGRRAVRAVGSADAAALLALLARLAAADAVFDPLCDAICAADDALDDALMTISGVLGVENPDTPDPEDMADMMLGGMAEGAMPPGRAAGQPTDLTGRSAQGADGGDSDVQPQGGETSLSHNPLDDKELRHLLLRARGVIT